MDGNGDLTYLAVVAPGHKKYVEALLQMPSFLTLSNDLPRLRSGPELQAKSEVAESLFGLPDSFRATLPLLEWGLSNVPAVLLEKPRTKLKAPFCTPYRMQNLACPKSIELAKTKSFA